YQKIGAGRGWKISGGVKIWKSTDGNPWEAAVSHRGPAVGLRTTSSNFTRLWPRGPHAQHARIDLGWVPIAQDLPCTKRDFTRRGCLTANVHVQSRVRRQRPNGRHMAPRQEEGMAAATGMRRDEYRRRGVFRAGGRESPNHLGIERRMIRRHQQQPI